MKNFDLSAAIGGAPVCTREGKTARVICYDRRGSVDTRIMALLNEGEYEAVEFYTENGELIRDETTRKDLMMRDDDYAEKLARGEYGPTVKEKLTVDNPTCKESLPVDREYWRRVYAGQIMPVVFHAAITTGAKVKDEYKDMPAVVAIARSTITLADALLAELDETEKK
ncbi:hypothetical protein [Alistipes finegoldii]|jgi:hypothetical protein|uniref:hypothetical protein n=1 Tax=uncultured Alistipes sp. TaxID=538949 RepID=UPI0020688FA1|nr:hypothetical protein [uncultured Alistipes sp.]DAL54669.1 MAG TPA_asm: hypothetical protein [Caudoviricetes sp.]